MELHSAGPCYGTQQAAIIACFVFRSPMGFFHTAWAYPCWVFPHCLISTVTKVLRITPQVVEIGRVVENGGLRYIRRRTSIYLIETERWLS